MTLSQLLDAYYLARTRQSKDAMIQIADILVEKEIPELIERLGMATLQRNEAQQKGSGHDHLLGCHL